jgi:hypothetical protein
MWVMVVWWCGGVVMVMVWRCGGVSGFDGVVVWYVAWYVAW